MRPSRRSTTPVLPALLAVAALVLSTARPVRAAPSGDLTVKTLKVADRLGLPLYRVEVGPDAPLPLRGRSRPVAFEVLDGTLRADADSEEGAEAVVESGRAIPIALDDGGVRHVAVVEGDPDAGEPRWSAVVVDVLEGRIGRRKVLFVDHDADGTFLTPDRDLLVTTDDKDVHPVHPVVVLGRDVFEVAFDEAGRRVESAPARGFRDKEVFPGWTGVTDGLAHLNRIRRGMNLPPVALSREASRAAMLHLRYCERNGGNGHDEEWDYPGYTKEGARAGRNSIGWIGGGSPAAAIDGHLGSLLHRPDLIDPRTTVIGIAAGGSRIWIYTEFGPKRPWERQGPVVFPGPNRSWRTGAYSGENPDPRPEEHRGASGLPVTVAWYGEQSILNVRAKLLRGGAPVPCLVNDADRHELKQNHAALRAILMPHGTLRSGTLVLTWEQDGRECRMEYRFRIGR